MFYEEQVRDGVLCYRSTPAGEWVPMSAERLTAMLLELRQRAPVAVPLTAPQPVLYPYPVLTPVPQWVPQTPWLLPYTITCGDPTQDGVGTLTGAVRQPPNVRAELRPAAREE